MGLQSLPMAFDLKHAPLTLGSVKIDPAYTLPVAVVVIVAALLLIGARREFATFAICAGVVGAFLTT